MVPNYGWYVSASRSPWTSSFSVYRQAKSSIRFGFMLQRENTFNAKSEMPRRVLLGYPRKAHADSGEAELAEICKNTLASRKISTAYSVLLLEAKRALYPTNS